jgi:hypothetical protein
MDMNIMSFDPLLIGSIILMQIGAKHLELELSDFQKKILKNNIIQAIILFCIIYIPIRDVFKSIIIVCLIYLLIYVFLNENHKYNIFSKQWLYSEGIIKNYNSIKDNYYKNLSKIKL